MAKIKYLFFSFFLVVFSKAVISQESADANYLNVTGKINYEKQKHPNLTVYVKVLEDGKHFKTTWLDDQGKFKVKIYPRHDYKIEFSAHYYNTSILEVKTNIPEDKIADWRGKTLDIDLELYEVQKDLDPSFFDKPLLKIYYLESANKFTHDYTHTETLKKLLIYVENEQTNAGQSGGNAKGAKVTEVVALMDKIENREKEIKLLRSSIQSDESKKELMNAEIVELKNELEELNHLLANCDSSEKLVFIETIKELNDMGGVESAREKLQLARLNAKTHEDSLLIALKERELNMIEEELNEANADLINKEMSIREKELEVKTQKQRLLYAIVGIGSVLVLLVFLFISFQKTRRANKLISNQKVEIENRNQEIQKSITYARRIQEAILPPTKYVQTFLKNSFILYKPKDIVAGDFYWFEVVGEELYFAAADCTGHGVPGAMVSVVCANALNRAINEMKISEPAMILDKVRELVIETFEKSESEVDDGMDISFCKLNLQTLLLTFSGAHNPLYRITPIDQSADDKTVKDDTHMLVDYRADMQPIGKFIIQKPFTQQEVQLLPGDSIYLFTDGYADQFGGPKDTKYSYKRFKKLCLSMHNHQTDEQQQIFNTAFEEWKGSEEQIDDVCLIGVRV